MDYIETLKAKEAQLSKELEAIRLLLGVDSSKDHNPLKIDGKRPPNQNEIKPRAAHEGIVAGKHGNCETTFIEASPATEFKRAGLTKDGVIVT